jgi:hypothetical protein
MMIPKVRDWLEAQGFTLEMHAASAFRAAGFEVRQSSTTSIPRRGRDAKSMSSPETQTSLASSTSPLGHGERIEISEVDTGEFLLLRGSALLRQLHPSGVTESIAGVAQEAKTVAGFLSNRIKVGRAACEGILAGRDTERGRLTSACTRPRARQRPE